MDMVHIDANHAEWPSPSDVVNWLPKLKVGGYIVMDDRAVLLETPGHQALAALPVDPTSPLLLLVGPAGGFEAAEAGVLRAAGFAAARWVHASCAPKRPTVAAVTIAQATWGDLR